MPARTVDSSPSPTVAVFAPHPLLTVTPEREGADREAVHFAASGQGVWVARTAGELGAVPALCSFIGGESGKLLQGLLDQLAGERSLVPTTTASGCYATYRRSGNLEVLSSALSDPPSRHELDDLFARKRSPAAGSWLPIRCPRAHSRSSSTVTSSPTSARTAVVRSLTCSGGCRVARYERSRTFRLARCLAFRAVRATAETSPSASSSQSRSRARPPSS